MKSGEVRCMMICLKSFSEQQTELFAQKISQSINIGDIICLKGELGVGKTLFTKSLCRSLGISDNVTSPTYSIVNEYHAENFDVYHFDVYRVNSLEDMDYTNYEEYFYGKGVCIIEWADLIESLIPKDAVWIEISKDLSIGESFRNILISNPNGGEDFYERFGD